MGTRIPNYELYGDTVSRGWGITLNFEWIPERSPRYGFHIRPHRHDAMLQLLHVAQGQGQVLLDEHVWQLPAPSIVLIPAGHVHGFDFSTDVNGPVITAAQKPLESLAQLIFPELAETLRQPTVLSLNDGGRYAEQLMPLFQAVEREWRTSSDGQIAACQSLFMMLLIQFHRIKALHGLGQGSPSQGGNGRRQRKIENFRALVDEHFREHRPVQWYAERMSLSPGQLSRLCREGLGLSALDVINARLVHEAQRDLVYSADSVKAVAADLGFVDEAYFSRFFRRQTGASPTRFRQDALQRLRQQSA